MFGWFKTKNKKLTLEERLAILEQALIAEQEAKKLAEAKLEEVNSEVAILREKRAEFDLKRNSTDPWVEVIGESVDPVKGIEIKLDWNEAFIQYLKDNGIKGKDEDAIVQKWLAFLYQDLVDKFEEKIINDSDIITPNEFE